jgi:Domain of unknown function (DUF3303)
MKIVVIYRPRHTPPFEAIPGMFEGVAEWIEKYGDRFESLYFFAGGGGIGIADVDDSAELQRMTAEHPFTIYADIEFYPAIDPETALKTLRDSLAPR